jgi:hypothetical protein
MAKTESIHLLDKLSQYSEFYTGIFFTYGADLAFFEEAVLHSLWQKGCRNNLVFMDARRYADTIDDLRGSVTWVGRRYILIPVDLGPLQSFHPKFVLLLGRERGRLLVGSGNLTFTGFGHNHELFTCLDWTPDEPSLGHLFAQTWALVKAVLQRWGHSNEAHTILSKAEYVSNWLSSPAEPGTDIQLFHTLEEPLIDQCSHALSGQAIDKITILSPFLDDAAGALNEIHSRFHPQELHLVLQDKRTVGNVQALERLRQEGVPLQIYRFSDDKRYLHAKAYIFETTDTSYVLTGSANCTRAAWLSACANSNIEVMLLRRADSPRHFAPLLKGYIEPNALTSLQEISIRREQITPPESTPTLVHLQDISVTCGMLSVALCLSSLPGDVTDLQLRLSTTPPRFIPLGECAAGSHTLSVPIPPELHRPLMRPLSASVWSTNVNGVPVDLHCNELWVTNVDVLRREVSRTLTPIGRAGDYLADMILTGEEEWRDLYESLVQLVELDVAGLKQRGGTYTASPPRKKPRSKADTEERETEIHLVDQVDESPEEKEIAAALFHESHLYAWFEHVHSRLPGAVSESGERGKRPHTPGTKRTRRRWTPPERIGRRFMNLVKKYIASLINVEYMQTVSPYHTLAYYSTFQRIVWLLLQHNVIDAQSLIQRVTEINRGFFGAPDEEPPILCPRLCQHIQSIWRSEWREAKVPIYALASVVLSERPMFEFPQLDEPEDKELAAQVNEFHEQNLQVLCGIASVMGLSWVPKDIETLAQQMGELYERDSDDFASQVMDHLEHSLSSISNILDKWFRRLKIALGKTDDPHLRKHLCRAIEDYGHARYDVLTLLEDVEAQTRLCSDLVFWTRCAGNPDAAREWSETLVGLLQAQGKGHRAAKEMFHQGRALFLNREYEEAANILRQASLLAERLGDSRLSTHCEQFLQVSGWSMND